jgi:hypothetical protein
MKVNACHAVKIRKVRVVGKFPGDIKTSDPKTEMFI